MIRRYLYCAQDFEVIRRFSSAQVALKFEEGNDGNVVEIHSVSLCPVPSRRQYCEGGPRQTASTALDALTQGDGRVIAEDQEKGDAVFGTLDVVRVGMPPYRALVESEIDPANRPRARAYFWPSRRCARRAAPAVKGMREGVWVIRVALDGGGGSRTQKHSEAGYGRRVDRGAWTAKTVKRPRQQPAHPQYANYWAPLTRKRHTMPHPHSAPTTGLRERGNDTSKSTGRSSRQKAATQRNMRREERVTVQGPVKKQRPGGMSHRGLRVSPTNRCPPPTIL